jgi:hypothetical protein
MWFFRKISSGSGLYKKRVKRSGNFRCWMIIVKAEGLLRVE